MLMFFFIRESAIAYSNAHYGQGNVSILIRNLNCNGLEVNIGQCDPSFDAPTRCKHSEDSGVDCCRKYNIMFSSCYNKTYLQCYRKRVKSILGTNLIYENIDNSYTDCS
jgi:hypothetical protein